MTNYCMTIKLAYFGDSIVNCKNPQDPAPTQPFSDLLLSHYGPRLNIVRWGQPGLDSLLEIKEQVYNHPINYDIAVVLHLWRDDTDPSAFQKAQKQILKYFEKIRRPALHCLDQRAPNMEFKNTHVTYDILKLTRLTRHTRNYVDLDVSVNNIDQVGNWKVAKVIESFIEQISGQGI